MNALNDGTPNLAKTREDFALLRIEAGMLVDAAKVTGRSFGLSPMHILMRAIVRCSDLLTKLEARS